MAVLTYANSIRDAQTVNLASALTGNGDTTNTLDRGTIRRAGLLMLTAAVGATPTVTVNILGSVDNTNFWNVAYATVAAPETVAVAALTITSAGVTLYILRDGMNHPWRFLKVNLSANTNVTLTVDVAA